jgi:cytochrome P450
MTATHDTGRDASSLNDHTGLDPFGFYEDLRAGPTIAWDSELHGWLVASYVDAGQVLSREDLFERADRHLPGGLAARGNTRYLNTINYEQHDKLHRMLMGLIDRTSSEHHRTTVVREEAAALVARFADRGRADLATGFTDLLPSRVGLRLLGLTDIDDATRDQVRLERVQMAKWDETLGEPPEVIEAVLDRIKVADRTLREVFLPYIRRRSETPEDDLISALWREGPSVFPDWGEDDVYAGCLTYLGGGETSLLLANAAYLLATNPLVKEYMRRLDGRSQASIIDEIIRVYGVVHWQLRLATRDQVLGDTEIKQGDRVFAVIGAANRDPRHFTHPTTIDTESKKARQHLGFGLGRRFCIGSYLARAEGTETLDSLYGSLPNLRLDPEREPPAFTGMHLRSFRPLFVQFDARFGSAEEGLDASMAAMIDRTRRSDVSDG